MSPRTKRLLIGLGVVAVLVWLGVFLVVWRLFRTPLGTPVTYATWTPAGNQTGPASGQTTAPGTREPIPTFPQATQEAAEVVGPEGTPTATVIAADLPQPTHIPRLPTPDPNVRGICEGPQVMYILAVGARKSVWDNSDTIRIIRVDFVKPEIVVVPIPRDLVVRLPEDFVERTGFGSPVKLASVNNLGSPAWLFDADRAGGALLMARVLDLNFGIRVDHYVVIDGLAFDNFINDIGGLQICLPTEVVDEEQGANFPAGCQVLDGNATVLLARIRKDVGDFGRIERQHLILRSLLRQIVTNPYTISQLPALINKYRQRVLTSFSPQDISQLLCLFTYLNPQEEIRFLEVPRELLQEGTVEIYIGTQPTEAYGLVWNEAYVQWLHKALLGELPQE